MKVEKIYVYPIKSIRGCELQTAELTPHGFPFDRSFMLLKDNKEASQSPTGERYQNMHVPHFPEMGLFTTEIKLPSDVLATKGEVRVTHNNPEDGSTKELTIPLQPDAAELESIAVSMHQSPTTGYRMPSEYSEWFSSCFGYAVVLLYIGPSSRLVLGNLPPNSAQRNPIKRKEQESKVYSLFTSFASTLPSFLNSTVPNDETADYTIRFADCSPYLFASRTSVDDVTARLDGETMDIRKFRPNIIVSGAATPWEEDYWGAVRVGGPDGILFVLTSNCVRCVSVNVDFATGAFAKGPSGEVLKRMQTDRRVDAGHKFNPVFGRYGFLTPGNMPPKPGGYHISVGDEVVVEKQNEERTVFKWPGIGMTKKADLFPL